MRNYNTLIGRYAGADGMKTGFICASGFNLVASATRDNKRLIAVVLGASSSQARAMKAAQLLERGFGSTGGIGWLTPSLGTVEFAAAGRCGTAESARGHVRRASQAARDRRRGRVAAAPIRTRIRPTRPSWRACVRRPRARRWSQGPASANRCVVYTGPARKPGDPLPVEADIKPKKRKPVATAKTTEGAKTGGHQA